MKIIVTVCIKEDGKLLMVQEAQKKAYKLWNLPGGNLNPEENIFDGAIRETKEETGYDIELISLISVQNYVRKEETIMRINFNAKVIGGNIDTDNEEVLDVKWIPINELEKMEKELRSPDSHMDIISDIKKNKEYPLDIIKNITQK